MSDFTPISTLSTPDTKTPQNSQQKPKNHSKSPSFWAKNPFPQSAPGANAVKGHVVDNGIPLSIFPISQNKLCLVVCGLPARGKTDISRRLARYLSFFHALEVATFDVAEYRRSASANESGSGSGNGSGDSTSTSSSSSDSDSGSRQRLSRLPVFDESNHDFREGCYDDALNGMREFLSTHEDGVAILDAVCTTHEWRLKVKTEVQKMGVKLVFIEVQNNDPEFLNTQINLIASRSPDYSDCPDIAQAEADIRSRISTYEDHYEPISKSHPVESKWSYFTCDHSRRHFIVHNVTGHMPLRVVNFIMNLRTTSHSFYLTRHGQSEYNVVGRIGGDSGLSEDHGMNYARKLGEFVENRVKKDEYGNTVPARLFTSTMRRTIETAQFIKTETITVKDDCDSSIEHEWDQMRPRRWFLLDEIFAGTCDGMTYEEIEEQFPEEFELRKVDKLAYRYPRGESYLDVIARLEPIVIEMERHREPLLIVGHQGILRIIYAFYTGLPRSEAPYVSIPLNTVIKLTPSARTCDTQRIMLYRPTIHLPSDGQDEVPESQRPTDTSVNIDPPSH
jgi:broad specificity phosphatase PhoE